MTDAERKEKAGELLGKTQRAFHFKTNQSNVYIAAEAQMDIEDAFDEVVEAARAAALEEAIKLADGLANELYDAGKLGYMVASHLADSIRALKDKGATPP